VSESKGSVMNDQQETIEELLQLAMKSEFDSKYKNETRLAFFFCRNAEKDLGIEIDNCKKIAIQILPLIFI
jgi:hypothetical protein